MRVVLKMRVPPYGNLSRWHLIRGKRTLWNPVLAIKIKARAVVGAICGPGFVSKREETVDRAVRRRWGGMEKGT